MFAPQSEIYPSRETDGGVLFDLRYSSAAGSLHSERAAWQEDADIEALGKDHFLLVRSGAVWRRAA